MIPEFKDVEEYMKGQDELVIKMFYDRHSAEGWMIGPHKIVNWKFAADNFIQALLFVNKKFRET